MVFDAGEVHPALLVTVKLCEPVANPVIVVLVPDPEIAPGLIVQVPDEGKLVKETLPVDVAQVGCVSTAATGADGVAG